MENGQTIKPLCFLKCEVHAQYLTQTQEATAELSHPLLSSSSLILENRRNNSAILPPGGREQIHKSAICTGTSTKVHPQNKEGVGYYCKYKTPNKRRPC